ncbi:hypothetical protein M8998_03875 [Sphingobacterium sp. lm-10]|uniref:hypothetical protein n=1 Tax=Sphingobacterium sp. lm-10 TaxID=2944904 RepID=UPI002020D70F|nr:hypothetical protein [Sphingobacterium sp. lm-10]MCL7987077.1 hypothetical protein [Sphingobacterium sp. lm-10]
MKYILLLILMMSNTILLQAQQKPYIPQGDDWKKEISGQYGHLEGVSLFEDGTFMLYGYATLVFGTYQKDADHLKFTTEKLDTVQVFGHHNPNLTGKSTMVFSGFERGGNFVQFDREMPQRVFNENANCFDSPFIFNAPMIPSDGKIIIVSGWEGEETHAWSFNNDQQLNEFVFVHNQPKRAYQDFLGGFYHDKDGNLCIQLSNYGGEKGYTRRYAGTENDQWNDILDMKRQYAGTDDFDAKYFVNVSYATFSEVDLSQYTFDESGNEYIKIDSEENNDYYDQNPYNDDRVLRKLERLSLRVATDVVLSTDKIKPGSIFYTTCEEPEKSYKSPNHVQQEEVESETLITIPPVPIPDRD